MSLSTAYIPIPMPIPIHTGGYGGGGAALGTGSLVAAIFFLLIGVCMVLTLIRIATHEGNYLDMLTRPKTWFTWAMFAVAAVVALAGVIGGTVLLLASIPAL